MNVFKEKVLLLVDDDPINIYAMTEALEDLEMNIITAGNGVEAIDQLHNSDKVDIILMDIMMPEMDGYEAMRLIRSETRYQELPIIALTAKAMRSDEEKCIEAGATGYLSKPVNIDELTAQMERLIKA